MTRHPECLIRLNSLELLAKSEQILLKPLDSLKVIILYYIHILEKKLLFFRSLGGNVAQTLPIRNVDVVSNLIRKHDATSKEKFEIRRESFGKEVLICGKLLGKERVLKRITLNERKIFQNKPTYMEIALNRDGTKLNITLQCLTVLSDGKTYLFINDLHYNMLEDFKFVVKFTSERVIDNIAKYGSSFIDEPSDDNGGNDV